jgi:hypothetical protein
MLIFIKPNKSIIYYEFDIYRERGNLRLGAFKGDILCSAAR